MGSQKSIKEACPLGSLDPVRELFTCWVTNKLANIIRPLAGQSPTTLKIPSNLWTISSHYTCSKGRPWSPISYDMKALFTSVLVNPAIQVVQNRLQQDPHLAKKTSKSIPQITTLLEFLPQKHILHFPV